MTREFHTNHSVQPKRVFSVAHGLRDGDRVVFLGGDPNYPADPDATASGSVWGFSSPNLPPAVLERRVYFVAAPDADSFEIKELASDTTTLDLRGDSSPGARIECGWHAELETSSPTAKLTWKPRTRYDDWIWLLMISANDISGNASPADFTIPNIDFLISRMREIQPRYLIITPPNSSASNHGPGSDIWKNYHDAYLPLVRQRYGDRVLESLALMHLHRTDRELEFLNDPSMPELLWIKGTPDKPETWEASHTEFEGSFRQWVGPGFIPLQFRARFNDTIHLGRLANELIGQTVYGILRANGW